MTDSIAAHSTGAFCINPQRRLPTKLWFVIVIIMTILTTTLILICVCTDQWESTYYDIHRVINLTNASIIHESDECSFTILESLNNSIWYLATYTTIASSQLVITNNTSTCNGIPRIRNITLLIPVYGGAFRLCLDVRNEIWPSVVDLCAGLLIDKCLRYSAQTVVRPFCCVKCLYTEDEVSDMDTSFEPIFTIMGFLIVSLTVLCACHILAIIAIWRRLVPAAMFTGILFLVSGSFLAFCLASQQYKVNMMNSTHRALPYMTWEMKHSSISKIDWSIEVGWMAFLMCILTGTLWIRLSYHLASLTPATYQVKPTMTMIHSNSIASQGHFPSISVTANPDIAGSEKVILTSNAAMTIPKSVRWANHRDTTSSITPNSRPNSGSNLLPNALSTNPTAISNGHVIMQNQHPLMVEDTL